MPDIVSVETRSKMMSGIKNKDTKPELAVRRALHAEGFRYLVNDVRLVGKPDLVFPKWHAVLFINGCFWHQHDCHLFKPPQTRTEFWKVKLGKNSERDRRNISLLLADGWRVGIVWECALKSRFRLPMDQTISTLSGWLRSSGEFIDIRGTL